MGQEILTKQTLSSPADNMSKVTNIKNQETENNAVNFTSSENSGENSPENEKAGVVYPHENLPRPEPPSGINGDVLKFPSENSFSVDVPTIGKYLLETKNSLSAAISRRLSLDDVVKGGCGVTEFYVSGLQVVVRAKGGENDGFASEESSELTQLKGRVTLFSRSNCR